jgi:formylmethanofuran--tetrahydromethanopterin N-formyltransferase
MAKLIRNGIRIDDTYAEAFGMSGTALIITAHSLKWAMISAATMTGFATSVIACGCEAGIDRTMKPSETPDGRPGVRVLLFSFNPQELQKQLQNRVGQCVLTSPGSACFAGLETGDQKLKIGSLLRYFGDGWQISKKVGGKHYWRIPVMEGEFLCEATAPITTKAVGGGNLLIMAKNFDNALRASEAAVAAMAKVPDAIMPFPGGIVRSGSKVGSKYKTLVASSNDAYCPTLKGVAKTELDADIGCVLEIVIDGLTDDAVREATRAGLKAIIKLGPKRGALRIGAGNYGGKLGQFHYHLKKLLP